MDARARVGGHEHLALGHPETSFPEHRRSAMNHTRDDDALEVTEEQVAALRDLGISQAEIDDLSFDDAEALIAECRAEREDAGRLRDA
jgi:hypothetical protein